MKDKDQELNKKQGDRLRHERKRKNMTQEQLAELSHYSIQHISYLENGSRKMSYESASAFADILGITADYLMCKTDFKPSGKTTDINIPLIQAMFENVLSIIFEYGYKFESIEYPTLNRISKFPSDWHNNEIIKDISKICANKCVSGCFYTEFLDGPETDYLLFTVHTPQGKIAKITPEQLSDYISDVIRFTQLKFLDISDRNISQKLKPISEISYRGVSDILRSAPKNTIDHYSENTKAPDTN